MVANIKPITVDDFERFITQPGNAQRLFELIHGEIVEKVPTLQHGVVCGNIVAPLWNFSRASGVGQVATEVRHHVPGDEHNDRLPDVSYYADASKPLIERGPTPYMPDLAVEVKSPDDTLPEMREKAAYYLAHGSRLVWLVYTEKRLVIVLTADTEDILSEADTLDGGDVIPGFKLPVRDIFPKK
jgi:Uma2 family endonuclease